METQQIELLFTSLAKHGRTNPQRGLKTKASLESSQAGISSKAEHFVSSANSLATVKSSL